MNKKIIQSITFLSCFLFFGFALATPLRGITHTCQTEQPGRHVDHEFTQFSEVFNDIQGGGDWQVHDSTVKLVEHCYFMLPNQVKGVLNAQFQGADYEIQVSAEGVGPDLQPILLYREAGTGTPFSKMDITRIAHANRYTTYSELVFYFDVSGTEHVINISYNYNNSGRS